MFSSTVMLAWVVVVMEQFSTDMIKREEGPHAPPPGTHAGSTRRRPPAGRGCGTFYGPF
jgi:hypothetical protein